MKESSVVWVDHEIVVPTPEVLLPQVVGYACDRVGLEPLCERATCIVVPPKQFSWLPTITHSAGCPATWLKIYAETGQHPFKTDAGFLDALLTHLAIHFNSFCTNDTCGGGVGHHVPDCLAWMVEPYLLWVRRR